MIPAGRMSARQRVSLLGVFLGFHATVQAGPLPQAQVYAGGTLLPFGCRTLDAMADYSVHPENLEFSKYGGWKARRVTATGFFRVEQMDGRWWAIDPEGYLYIHKAPNSIHLDDFTADEIYQLLPQYGFNGTGSWTDEELFQSSLKDDSPLAYCPKISFIAEYRRDRAPRIEMPVFDVEFEAFCTQRAQAFLPYVNDPHVFGYFSDNELSWTFTGGLTFHLQINDPTDENYITAMAFIADRGITAEEVDNDDKDAYTLLMAERYYSVVSAAIKNVDPNHLYIGSRVNRPENHVEGFFRAAGKYVDVFSINHSHRWGARDVMLNDLSEWTGRPLIVTEFYAMQDLPGTEIGAGWRVLDQAARGLFYQHFLTTLADTGCVVGWHWFKFQDDGNGNKGMVDASGNPYTTLLQDMQQMNHQIYNYIDYTDSRPPPDVTLLPEADAYFKNTANFGADPELLVKQAATSVYRESYLRFDLSTVAPCVASAKIHLSSVANDMESGSYQAELVADNTWGELTIAFGNHPAGSTLLASWSHGDDVVIDVAEVLLDALASDRKLSIRIISTLNNGSIPRYGSRENPDPLARPRLVIHYGVQVAYAAWASDQGLTEGLNHGYEDDPDLDGMKNFLEYALGADPLVDDATSFLPRLEMPYHEGINYLNYIYSRRIDRDACGLTYAVEASDALVAPQWGTDGMVETGAGPLDDEYESVTNRVWTDVEANRFLQLKITSE